MEVRATGDPAELLARAEPFLLMDEARHSLMLGIAGGLLAHPRLRAWTVEDEGEVVGAAMQTPPFNLALAQPSAEGALETLAATPAAEEVEVPGVTAAAPEVDDFASLWTSAGLAEGRSVCVLYTDLDNRTSNRIYMEIGYEPVCDSLAYVFEPDADA